ncbi:hypothetical protein DER46DRAFT_567103 [Fusarium sp. MPI-SDFR-AT-0072]|nr:hypothetical protein DER46DRAFT_567103 [Fusarium sp. MPI-SDFR-AT-0072]
MSRARKRIKLEDVELSFSAQECIVVDTHIKEERESKPKVAQGPGHDLSTPETNTVFYPFCSECRWYFPSNVEKERHNSKWHCNHICYACDEGFPSEPELLQHKAGHTETPVCCVGCEKRFKTHSETGLRDLLAALKGPIEENEALTFRCNVCRKNFVKEVALTMHQRDKHEHTYCCACETYFANPAKKQKHVMSGISVKPGTYFCDHCDPKVLLGSEKELCDHLWLEHMACGPCGQVFETVQLKKQHDAEAHNSRALRCSSSTGEDGTDSPTRIPTTIPVNMEIREELHASRVAPVVAESAPMKIVVVIIRRRYHGDKLVVLQEEQDPLHHLLEEVHNLVQDDGARGNGQMPLLS